MDLPAQTVTDPAGRSYHFDIHPVRKQCLLEGLDDIARTQKYAKDIQDFEEIYYGERSWLKAAGSSPL